MPIPTHLEPASWALWGHEACCFCHQPTRYWTDLKDRTQGEQVACCPGCADIFEADVVPSKLEWFEYHAGLRAHGGA